MSQKYLWLDSDVAAHVSFATSVFDAFGHLPNLLGDIAKSLAGCVVYNPCGNYERSMAFPTQLKTAELG